MSGRAAGPATENTLYTNVPYNQRPSLLSATTVGPMLSFFVPSMSSEAVGTEMMGPAPQMTWPTLDGDKNNERLISPTPDAPPIPGAGSGVWITGMIVRVIRFQSFDNLKGTTGFL